jgi:hypothetical protein
MSVSEIRDLAKLAALRLEAAVTQRDVWQAEIDRIQHVVAWSQTMQAIAVAAIESAIFGGIGGQLGKMIGARLFVARAPLIAARAIVGSARAGVAARRVAAGRIVVEGLQAAQRTGQLLGAVSGALLQVGAKTAYADQALPDVLLTIGMSLIPASKFSELSDFKVTQQGRTVWTRAVLPHTAYAWFSSLPGRLKPELNALDLADTVKTLADEHMTPSGAAPDRISSHEEFRAVLAFAAREAAILAAQHVHETASAIVDRVGDQAARRAEHVDYAEITGKFVAFYSKRDQDLEYVSINYARHEAQAELWNAALRAYARLEEAVLRLEQGLDVVTEYRGPYIYGSQTYDLQNRAN